MASRIVSNIELLDTRLSGRRYTNELFTYPYLVRRHMQAV